MKSKVIKKVLMCEPTFFPLLTDVYNPWMMPGKILPEKTQQQWQQLKETYENLGITVETIQPQKDTPDMVFAADQGLVHEDKVLLSRFRPKQRRKEAIYYRSWFESHGYTVTEIPQGYFLEGNGEIYFWNQYIFMGTGYRSSREMAIYLQKYFDREVILLEVEDPAFYHLDVGFFPLNHETIFYYPPAYSLHTKNTLQKIVKNLVPFTKEEAYGFCSNSVTTDHHVILQKNNPTFSKKLHELGYKTVEVELEEFKKSGGGAHCLTNILQYKND